MDGIMDPNKLTILRTKMIEYILWDSTYTTKFPRLTFSSINLLPDNRKIKDVEDFRFKMRLSLWFRLN
jgi:hypothetical protein